MAEFKQGDVVRLRSGGAPMTVLSTDDSKNTIDCAWMNKIDNFKQKQKLPQGAVTKGKTFTIFPKEELSSEKKKKIS